MFFGKRPVRKQKCQSCGIEQEAKGFDRYEGGKLWSPVCRRCLEELRRRAEADALAARMREQAKRAEEEQRAAEVARIQAELAAEAERIRRLEQERINLARREAEIEVLETGEDSDAILAIVGPLWQESARHQITEYLVNKMNGVSPFTTRLAAVQIGNVRVEESSPTRVVCVFTASWIEHGWGAYAVGHAEGEMNHDDWLVVLRPSSRRVNWEIVDLAEV